MDTQVNSKTPQTEERPSSAEIVRERKQAEKIELAKSLELSGYLNFCAASTVKFSETSEREIARKLLQGGPLLPVGRFLLAAGIGSWVMACILIGFLLCGAKWNRFSELEALAGTVLMIAGSICCQMVGRYTLEVEMQRLKGWQHDIPYGAMLKVQDAKAQGLCDFRIWFPVRNLRRLSDPIITGRCATGKLREIFHWDDGKIIVEG